MNAYQLVLTNLATFIVGLIFGALLNFGDLNSFTSNGRPFDNFGLLNMYRNNGALGRKSPAIASSYSRQSARTRILCLVITQPTAHDTKARAVAETWARRCDGAVFVSTTNHSSLPTIVLNVTESRKTLWLKTLLAFSRAYEEQYFDNFDWFLKADDDTYVVVDNLRRFLSDKRSNEPVYYGCKFKIQVLVKSGYNSGGAGYVLSKEALRRLATNSSSSAECAGRMDQLEDVIMGKCMGSLGVTAGDTRDALGRHRFLPLQLSKLVTGTEHASLQTYLAHPMSKGAECCSDQPISFHYVAANEMHVLEYLLYNATISDDG